MSDVHVRRLPISSRNSADVAPHHVGGGLFGPAGVYGNGRRPEPEFRVNPLELDLWNMRNRKARETYRREHPVQPPLTVACVCGGMFATAQGLANHGRHCPERAS